MKKNSKFVCSLLLLLPLPCRQFSSHGWGTVGHFSFQARLPSLKAKNAKENPSTTTSSQHQSSVTDEEIETLRAKLFDLWVNLGVTKSVNQTKPPIPPFTLLKASKNFAIRDKLLGLGGGERAAELLGVEFLGKRKRGVWRDFVANSPALQELVYNESNPYDPYISPLSKYSPLVDKNNTEKIRKELNEIWADYGVTETIDPLNPPIPPRVLIPHQRIQIERIINVHGGTEELSRKLGGVEILRGRPWKQLVEASPVLQELVKNESNSFHPVISPHSSYAIDNKDGEKVRLERTKRKTRIQQRPGGLVANNLDYVRTELYEFWAQQGITDKIIDPLKPPIPTNGLVKVLERKDIEMLWTRHGGREALGKKLGVQVINGRSWKKSVNSSAALQALVSNTSNAFSIDVTPYTMFRKRYDDDNGAKTRIRESNPRDGKRPPGYWLELKNVKQELVSFWKHLGVTDNLDPEKPPLPSHSFLHFMGRHDLTYVYKVRNKTWLAEELGVESIGGTWRNSVKSNKIMQEVVDKNRDMFHPEIPPGQMFDFEGDKVFRKKGPQGSAVVRKHAGFWSDYDREKVRQLLYEFWVEEGMADFIDPKQPPIPHRKMLEVCDRTDIFVGSKSIGKWKELGERLELPVIPERLWLNSFRSSDIMYVWAQNKTNAAKLSSVALGAFERVAQSEKMRTELLESAEKRRNQVMAASN